MLVELYGSLIQHQPFNRDCHDDNSEKEIKIYEIEADVQPVVIVDEPKEEKETINDNAKLNSNMMKIQYDAGAVDSTRKRSSSA